MKNGNILFFVLALVILISCSRDSGTNPNGKTAEITDEAKQAALWLTNELSPPTEVALQISGDLELIRSRFADSLSIFNQQFRSPADPRELIVGLTADAVAAFRAGTYENWNYYNDYFMMVKIDTSSLKYFGSVLLTFQDVWNPLKLGTYYKELDGVRYADPSWWGGDFSNFYPWYVNGEIAYLFRKGWGDCPCGCIYSHFWYVKKIDSEFELIGDFNTENQDPIPDWWDEVSEAYTNYWYHISAD